MKTTEYLSGPEDMRRRELVWGVVREPPAPHVSHQRLITHLTVLLDTHVREHGLGTVLVSPTDVVLDEPSALVVQPDILFVSHARDAIIQDCIRGAPDLVIEVVSRSSLRYDRVTKVGWYATYGVSEYWVVDPQNREVVVHALERGTVTVERFLDSDVVRSAVLPLFAETAAELLGED